jgi:peptidoglycan/LPS O-acetylase OafA/YrhL
MGPDGAGGGAALGFLITWFPRLFSLGPVVFLGHHSLHVFVWHAVLFAAFTVWVKTQGLPPGILAA